MMMSLPNIKQLIAENRLTEALEALDAVVASNPGDDEALFARGKLNWRLDRRSEAVTDFEHALAINPESPAATALKMARDVFDYFNPDLLNP